MIDRKTLKRYIIECNCHPYRSSFGHSQEERMKASAIEQGYAPRAKRKNNLKLKLNLKWWNECLISDHRSNSWKDLTKCRKKWMVNLGKDKEQLEIENIYNEHAKWKYQLNFKVNKYVEGVYIFQLFNYSNTIYPSHLRDFIDHISINYYTMQFSNSKFEFLIIKKKHVMNILSSIMNNYSKI